MLEPPSSYGYLGMLRENVREALGVLQENPLRSSLTLLGIIIAVVAIIFSTGLGLGAQREALKIINANGAYQLSIIPTYDSERALGTEGQGRLTLRDMEALKRAMPEVQAMAPRLNSLANAVVGTNFAAFELVGTTQDIHLAANHQPLLGRLLNAEDVKAARRVVVLGATPAQKLFGVQNPIGQSVRINNVALRVIGVLPKRGGSLSGNIDDVAFAPIELVRQRFVGTIGRAPDSLMGLTIILRPDQDLQEKRKQVRSILRERYKLRPEQVEPFSVLSSEEQAQQATRSQRVQQSILIGIALVSLLVGGIGIMNTILVSVTERVREIGLRKALGARKQDIYLQFLCESVILCLLGGLVGLALALAGTHIVGTLIDLDMSVGLPTMALALGLALGVGVLAGLYPAQRAANLDPLVALRTD
jgi:putative ABC transport system permease protein